MQYYPFQKNWTRKIRPHLHDKKLNEILVRDFNRYSMGRYGHPFTAGMLPEQIESCDWRFREDGRRGPKNQEKPAGPLPPARGRFHPPAQTPLRGERPTMDQTTVPKHFEWLSVLCRGGPPANR